MLGRVIRRVLSKSDRFNRALHVGPLPALVYVMTYLHADDWGHIPFDPPWVIRECLPDLYRTTDIGSVEAAMNVLVDVRLWEYVYNVGERRYVYIYQFDTMCGDALRHRRRGQWPDESGVIPKRRPEETLNTSLAVARIVRQQGREGVCRGQT